MTRPAMRIVSLVPGATDALVELGAGDLLVGRSHECDHPGAWHARPLTRPLGPASDASGAEIERAVREAAGSGSCLSALDGRALRAARPDLVVVQGACGVCAVGPDDVERAFADVGRRPAVLVLAPTRLEDVIADVVRLGEAIDRPRAGRRLVSELRERLLRVREAVVGEPSVRAVVLEWLDPPYRAGHWIPDQVRAAGGEDPLGLPGLRSEPVAPAAIAGADADALILAPCGLDAPQTAREARRAGLLEALAELGSSPPAFAIDSGALISRSGPRLVEGVETMAAILRPDLFGVGVDAAEPGPGLRVTAPERSSRSAAVVG